MNRYVRYLYNKSFQYLPIIISKNSVMLVSNYKQAAQYAVTTKVEPDNHNDSVHFQQISKVHTAFLMNKNGIYYPYNNFFKDQGWGCAWRAIQTLLSSRYQLSFDGLYKAFSEKIQLLSILKQHKSGSHQLISILENKKWAPSQIECHWAQPFIASFVCLHYQIDHSLLLLNGYPNAYAPLEAFSKPIKFEQFRFLIKNNIEKGSIMIDDGHYALSIIGYRQIQGNKYELLFADPHIKSNKIDKSVGLYTQIFDATGKNLGYDLSKSQKEEALYSVYEKLHFQNKAWMICITH